MIIQERLTFGQTYVVQSDGPIKITQTGAHGTLEKVNVTDEAGTAGREVVFTAIDTAAQVEVDEGTNWSCVPGFNRGAASAQGGPAELPSEQKTFLQWVTDGKLTFDADGRLKIATSVDATGTFNHDGYASNYTKTVDGVRYTTMVNATEVIVKKSVAGVETVLMHLKDGELELGGSRVLTEAGERVLNATMSGTTASVTMHHSTVVEVPSECTAVVVAPNSKTGYSKQTHLVLTPAAPMPTGWLTASDGAVVRWPFGEIAMPAGWSYIITLVQVGKVILANALPVDLSTPTA